MTEAAIEFLLKHQNPDGGWGVVPGRVSNTEATSLAVLAGKLVNQTSVEKSLQRGTQWLAGRQLTDGSWPVNGELNKGSWVTPLAVIALHHFPDQQVRAIKGAEWIVKQRGRGLPLLASLLVRLSITKLETDLNPNLTGWSWTAGAFSWVEPTSYALIALKQIRGHLKTRGISERIEEGEEMIYDRMCVGGGWNYGNSIVFGENLWPYPDTTALALIALQDHHNRPANRQSLEALQTMLKDVHTGLALSWSIICLSLYGEETKKWKDLLAQAFQQTHFLGETKNVALSILAMEDGAKFFKI